MPFKLYALNKLSTLIDQYIPQTGVYKIMLSVI